VASVCLGALTRGNNIFRWPRRKLEFSPPRDKQPNRTAMGAPPLRVPGTSAGTSTGIPGTTSWAQDRHWNSESARTMLAGCGSFEGRR